MSQVLIRVLPRRNLLAPVNYAELIEELADFGTTNTLQLSKLLKRHRKSLIAIDREPMDVGLENDYRQQLGDAYVADRLRKQVWFSWEALVRIALELEYGERYDEYRSRRDAP